MNVQGLKTVKTYSNVSFLFHSTGIFCNSYQPLEGNCEQIVNGTAQLWRTVKCHCSSWKDKWCCSSWCKQSATCLSQTTTWKERCARKFYRYRYRPSLFTITPTAIRNDSYPRKIVIKSCGWRRAFFTIKITIQNSGSGNTTNG